MQLSDYNEKQIQAIKQTEGPVLVLAGAGSGKTKVLTTRIAYLISEIGVDPSNILAITFTNKAAKEMKNRTIGLLGSMAYDIQISTFHSFGLLLIKQNYEQLGYSKNFTILDSEDTLTLIKKILKDMNLDVKEYNPKAIKNRISNAKNELIDAQNYDKYVNTDFDEKVSSIYKIYETKLKLSNSVDFDDLLMKPIILFKEYSNILNKYQDKFKYILIDEYQDTNEAQYVLIKMLSKKNKNICVVGDESQSIYSFRGSNYKNILNFENDYKNSKTILLEQNYRSTKTILSGANEMIKNNKERKDKTLWTNNEQGDKINYYRSYDEKDESSYVVSQIKELVLNNELKSNIAVLYRTNAQSRNIEEAMLRENIPYKVVGSFYFYNRKEIKDLISYLRLIYNPNDDMSLLRVINTPKRGIGSKSIESIVYKANLNNTCIFDSIDSGKELEFKKVINELILEKDNGTLTELVDLILEKTGIKFELLSEKTLDSEIRLENLEEFKSITKSFEEQKGIVSLEDFLQEISLVADISEHKDETDVVTLMTVHSAKGLEFNDVFVIGLEEGIFPHKNSLESVGDLEEERRLFYVAMTRAKKKLWLVNSKKRMLYGIDNINPPSRFINEIGENYINCIRNISDKQVDITSKIDKSKLIDSSIEYELGDHVMHELFGEGVIVNINKSVLTIAFSNLYGIKTLMKGHKSIKKI